ncbi:MAG: hypothetical protein H0W15_05320 [Gemmatimonadales bacterium]|nr:hypothetical protein [Gemmatimonadales bacterium]
MPLIIWALVTGFVTGAVWVAIVLMQSQRRLRQYQVEMGDHTQARLDHLDSLESRLADVEDRLAFTERMLTERQDAPALGRGTAPPAP